MEAFKTFIKSLEAPQRNVKTKINLFFSFRPGMGRKGLNHVLACPYNSTFSTF